MGRLLTLSVPILSQIEPHNGLGRMRDPYVFKPQLWTQNSILRIRSKNKYRNLEIINEFTESWWCHFIRRSKPLFHIAFVSSKNSGLCADNPTKSSTRTGSAIFWLFYNFNIPAHLAGERTGEVCDHFFFYFYLKYITYMQSIYNVYQSIIYNTIVLHRRNTS